MRFILATIVFVIVVAVGTVAPAFADTIQIESPDGKVTVDALEIEIGRSYLRAQGDARVTLPPVSSIDVAGPQDTAKKDIPAQVRELPVVIEAPTVEIRYPAYRAFGGVKLSQGDVSMTAEEISGNFEQNTVQASGGVVFKQAPREFFTQEFEYNYATQTGRMTEARFRENNLFISGKEIRAEEGNITLSSATATTCDKLENPDYRITAREIVLTRDRVLIARRVTLWLGKTMILSLPRLKFNVGGPQTSRSLFPRPGYNSDDGFFVGLTLPVSAEERFFSNLWIRWTTRNAFQGRSSNEYLLTGKEQGVLTQLITGSEVELRDRPALLPRERETGTEIDVREKAGRQLRVFADVSNEERVYDIDEGDLLVSRRPEVGLKYILPALQLDNDEDIPDLRSEGRISWGRFKESDRLGHVDRLDARAFVAPTLINLPSDWFLMPMGLIRWSHYSTGDDYTSIGFGADITKMLAPGTFGTLRYINHLIDGETPLEFDDVDIREEVQSILQYRGRRDFFAVTLRYDVNDSDLYDWQLTYGRTLHCLEPRITWRNRFSQLGIELKVLGF